MKKVARPSDEVEKTGMPDVFKIEDPGHSYTLTSGQKLNFLKKDGKNISPGTINEEVFMVLLDRLNFLNDRLPCKENEMALAHLNEALKWLNIRTLVRVQQKVEGTEKPHDPAKAMEYLSNIKSNTL